MKIDLLSFANNFLSIGTDFVYTVGKWVNQVQGCIAMRSNPMRTELKSFETSASARQIYCNDWNHRYRTYCSELRLTYYLYESYESTIYWNQKENPKPNYMLLMLNRPFIWIIMYRIVKLFLWPFLLFLWYLKLIYL